MNYKHVTNTIITTADSVQSIENLYWSVWKVQFIKHLWTMIMDFLLLIWDGELIIYLIRLIHIVSASIFISLGLADSTDTHESCIWWNSHFDFKFDIVAFHSFCNVMLHCLLSLLHFFGFLFLFLFLHCFKTSKVFSSLVQFKLFSGWDS